MELEKAIEILGTFKLADIIEIITQEEFEDVKTAIDTVLQELNNRIPRKDIEDIYNELKKVYEDELNRLGMTMKGSALDVLEYILNKYKE